MRTSAAPLLGLAFLLAGIASGCSSVSPEDEEFLRRHRWFFQASAREAYLADPAKREELRAAFFREREEQVRPAFLPAVKAGRIEVGMTRSEVLFALGSPDTATSAETDTQLKEWHEYEIGGERVTLDFTNGVLDTILKHPEARAGGIGAGPPRGGGGPPR